MSTNSASDNGSASTTTSTREARADRN
jgi:hypothetical protein